jgi:hypothetical protein
MRYPYHLAADHARALRAARIDGMLDILSALMLLAISPHALAATLKYTAPAGWTSKPPSSSSRVAECVLPKADGDKDDASLVVYFFSATGGRSVQANVDRWISQMAQPDGRASKDLAKTSAMTVNGLKVTDVDVTGTYVAEMSPGATEHFNYPGWRLRAAVVETPGGAYYIKVTGPAKTVAKWDAAYGAFLNSLKYE